MTPSRLRRRPSCIRTASRIPPPSCCEFLQCNGRGRPGRSLPAESRPCRFLRRGSPATNAGTLLIVDRRRLGHQVARRACVLHDPTFAAAVSGAAAPPRAAHLAGARVHGALPGPRRVLNQFVFAAAGATAQTQGVCFQTMKPGGPGRFRNEALRKRFSAVRRKPCKASPGIEGPCS